jgi:hypothetical protein
MFVDMDGVIASYDFGRPLEFDKKRPLLTNIKTLEEVSKIPGVKLHILLKIIILIHINIS